MTTLLKPAKWKNNKWIYNVYQYESFQRTASFILLWSLKQCFIYSLMFSCSGFILANKILSDFNNSIHHVVAKCLCIARLCSRHRIQKWRCHNEIWMPQDSKSLQALGATMANQRSSWGGLVLSGNDISDDVSSLRPDHKLKGTWWGGLQRAGEDLSVDT